MGMIQERLKTARQNSGLTQIDVAKKLNISRQAYNHYETGKRTPNPETISSLAEIYGVTTDYLLGNADVPTSPSKDRDILDEIKFAFWGHDDITDAMLDDVRKFALFVEEQEKLKKEKEQRNNESNGETE